MHEDQEPDGPWKSDRAFVRDVLEARGWSTHELWFDYVALTGNATAMDFTLFVDHGGDLPAREVDVVRQAAIELLYEDG